MGTLTSSNSNSMHASVFLIVLYKSCAVTTPIYTRDPPTKKIIIASSPSRLILRRASFHGVTGFLHHSTTIKLIPCNVEVLLEVVRAGTPESKVRVWSRSLDPIDSIG
jgi:hypothetical protein